MEDRRENVHGLVTQCYWPQGEETYLTTRKESDPTLPSQQEEGKIPPYPVTAPPKRYCSTSANEKSLYFQLSISSHGLFIYKPASKSIKDSPLLCFSGLPCGLSLGQIFWITILGCYQGKSNFQDNYLAVYFLRSTEGMTMSDYKGFYSSSSLYFFLNSTILYLTTLFWNFFFFCNVVLQTVLARK